MSNLENERGDPLRCLSCGNPWTAHSPECSRHPYRPGATADDLATMAATALARTREEADRRKGPRDGPPSSIARDGPGPDLPDAEHVLPDAGQVLRMLRNLMVLYPHYRKTLGNATVLIKRLVSVEAAWKQLKYVTVPAPPPDDHRSGPE